MVYKPTPEKTSDEEQRKKVYWTQEERDRFVKSVVQHGFNLAKLKRLFRDKTEIQIKNFWLNNKTKGLGLLSMINN